MANQTNGNPFRDDEIIILEQLRDGKMVKNIFPKIGGRLRLAHEENDQLSIISEIIRYDENIAVFRAITTTMKGNFPGLGMSSIERDHSIAPAILELAETRAIARSLRFAGDGVEYCSAEEVTHLQLNGDSVFSRRDTPAQITTTTGVRFWIVNYDKWMEVFDLFTFFSYSGQETTKPDRGGCRIIHLLEAAPEGHKVKKGLRSRALTTQAIKEADSSQQFHRKFPMLACS